MDYRPNRIFAPFLYGRGVDRVIAISRAVEDSLAAAGVSRENITVIPSGVDTLHFAPPSVRERGAARAALGLDDSTIAIGAVGALEERKGHRYLLQAIARLPRTDGAALRCFIAGEGSIRRELELEAARLGCSERVAMLGRVEDTRAILWALDIFAMPSILEGLGVAALEAMACGLPIVASRTGGLAELVEDRRTGMMVPTADPDSLAMALEALMSDSELRWKLGLNAKVEVVRKYSMQAMAERTLEVYLEALRDK